MKMGKKTEELLRSACRWEKADPGCLLTILIRVKGLPIVDMKKVMEASCTRWYTRCRHFRGFKELIKVEPIKKR